jgi:hypothetical protein
MAENRKRTITGPGAADFIAAPGGEDIPGVSPNKGETELRDETPLTDPKNLEPALAPEVDPPNNERTRFVAEDLKRKNDKQKDRE